MRLFKENKSGLNTDFVQSKTSCTVVLIPVLEVVGSLFGIPGIGSLAGAILGQFLPEGSNSPAKRINDGFQK